MKKILAVAVISLGLSQSVIAAEKLSPEQAKMQAAIDAKIVEETGKDTNRLVEQGATIAIKKIKAKEMNPFCMMELRDGSIIGVEADEKIAAKMKLQDKVGFLRGQIIAQVAKGNVKTAGLFVASVGMASNGKQINGVSVEVEHYTGFSMQEFVPYKIEGDKVTVGEAKKQPKPVVFFNPQSIEASKKADLELADKLLDQAGKK